MARGIYGWFVSRSNKAPLVYVGQARVIERRRLTYIREWATSDGKLTTNTRLAAAVKRYGAEAVSFRVLELVEETERLTERERYWLTYYKNQEAHGHYKVANFIEPGDNSMTSPAVRAAHKRATNRPEFKAAVARMNAITKAKSYTFRSPTGERICLHNLSEFCRQNGLHHTAMVRVAKGERTHHKGWNSWNEKEEGS